ncbi:MAG: DUF4197 domain-containing protein [Granulosicoccaceae bacterium]
MTSQLIKWVTTATLCSLVALSGCTKDALVQQAGEVLQQVGGSGGLSNTEISAGLKQALEVSTGAVVSQLGAAGGFANDPKIHIPLPENLRKARDVASKVGLSKPFDQLEDKLNAAAEEATPKAKALFLDAISSMTLEDAKGILGGADDAATQYLKQQMGPSLDKAMQPVVSDALAEVGAVKSYDSLVRSTGSFAQLMPDLNADLNQHVVDAASKGIFSYLAEEEVAIRADPAKRTTELLKRVFQ